MKKWIDDIIYYGFRDISFFIFIELFQTKRFFSFSTFYQSRK